MYSWYYDTEERDRAMAEAKARGRIGGQGGAVSDADNAAARKLLQSVMNGKGPATSADIETLAVAAEALPAAAAHMVAQVTMGSSWTQYHTCRRGPRTAINKQSIA